MVNLGVQNALYIASQRTSITRIFPEEHAPETQLYSFILPLTRNTTTAYRNTLKIIYYIPTKLFTRSNVVKARQPI